MEKTKYSITFFGEEGGKSNFLALGFKGNKYIYGWFRLFPLWSVKFAGLGDHCGKFYRQGICLSIFIPLLKIWKLKIKFSIFCWKEIDDNLYFTIIKI